MCQRYSAETEEALKKLIPHESSVKLDEHHANAEMQVLSTLRNDPYQLPCVRRAIRFYLLYHRKLPAWLEANDPAQTD